MEINPSNVYAVLLAGGVGSRLWPVSRQHYPKQLVKFIGDDSLVQSTVKRVIPVLDSSNLRIVCGAEHIHEIARQIKQIGIDPEGKIIAEPCGRNTAPAILLAVSMILQANPNAVVCVFPADHVIKDVAQFRHRLLSAIRLAGQGHIVTFGIRPHYPETGYGYIEGGDPVGEGAIFTRRFVEKPDRQTAEAYLAAGNYYWNSGMFAFSGSTILEEFARFQPGLLEAMNAMDLTGPTVPDDNYRSLSDISIDYAIMEKTRKGAVLPSDFGWSDIGTWKSLYEFLSKDDQGNVIEGDVICQQTRNSFILSGERLIAANNVSGLVVVETPDSVFVSDIETSRDVKSIVSALKEKGRREFLHHQTVHYAWGCKTLLDQTPFGLVERWVLYPGCESNLAIGEAGQIQIVVLKGQAQVAVGAKRRVFSTGESLTVTGDQSTVVINVLREDLHIVRISVFESTTRKEREVF